VILSDNGITNFLLILTVKKVENQLIFVAKMVPFWASL